MMALVRETLRGNLSAIHTPTWVAYHYDDDVVSVPKMRSALRRFGVEPALARAPRRAGFKTRDCRRRLRAGGYDAVREFFAGVAFLAAEGLGVPEA